MAFADFDNDGDLDLYAAGGSYLPEFHDYCIGKDHPDKVYRNNGNGTFTDFTRYAGVAFNQALTYAAVVGDYDNDGDLDVFLSNSIYQGHYESQNILLQNNGNRNHWLHLKLIGNTSNYSAIGARVKLITDDLVQIREVCGGIGAGGQSSLPVEFGLGQRTQVDTVLIRWPSGIIQQFINLPIDQLMVIEEPYRIGFIQLGAGTVRVLRISLPIILSVGLIIIAFSVWIYPVVKKNKTRKQQLLVDSKTGSDLLRSPLVELNNVSSHASIFQNLLRRSKPTRLSIKIELIPFRDEYLLDYSVVSPQRPSIPSALFHQEKIPYPIKQIKIQRLRQKIQQLWSAYVNYIHDGRQNSIKPISLLQEIGERIFHYCGLTAFFEELFALESRQQLHLNIIVNNPIIPWQWAFHPAKRQFLCDQFAYGFSFSTLKVSQEDFTDSRKLRGKDHFASIPSVIFFYGDWKGHLKALKHVESEVFEIGHLLESRAVRVYYIYQDCDQFVATIHQLNLNNENLRFIHYSGHIEQNILELGEQEFLAVNFLRDAYGLTLPSHPLVFLNGCCSGQFQQNGQKYENLATEFLNCGAQACIITQYKIPENSAKNFAIRFYHYFVEHQLTVAQALRQTRLDWAQPELNNFSNPDYDLTRYFYDLYGEPTVKF